MGFIKFTRWFNRSEGVHPCSILFSSALLYRLYHLTSLTSCLLHCEIPGIHSIVHHFHVFWGSCCTDQLSLQLLHHYPLYFILSLTMPETYTLTPQAYALPILHSALHPSSTTIGLFLASASDITEVVPLQHINTSLSPYTELGLELATAYAEGKRLKIVGIYVAHESETKGLGRIGERILARVGGFGVVLNNERLGAGEGAFDVRLSPFSDIDVGNVR